MKDCNRCELKGKQCNDCWFAEAFANLKKDLVKDLVKVVTKLLDSILWVLKKLHIISILVVLVIPMTTQAAQSRHEAIVRRVLRQLPECENSITKVRLLNRQEDFSNRDYYGMDFKLYGQFNFIADEIYIYTKQSPERFKETLVHECGHAVDYATRTNNKLQEKAFGREPFLSVYSRTNSTEDFAETYLFMKNNPRKTIRLARRNKNLKAKFDFITKAIKKCLE